MSGDPQEPRWLEGETDPGKQRLREALDEATPWSASEVRQRRVWARLQNLPQEGRRARQASRRAFVLGALATSAVGVVAFVLFDRLPPRPPEPAPTVAAATPAPAAGPEVMPLPPPAAATTPSPARPQALGPTQTVQTGGGERLVRALRDGVEVEIRPRSVLAVDEQGTPEVRAGRVGFTVAPQPPGQHFTVRAGGFKVVVVGTRFLVKVDSGDVGVSVDEGVVEIRDRKNLSVARVTAGQSWSQPRGGRVAAAANPRPPAPATEPDPDQDLADARAARAASDPKRAVAIYQRLAGRGGPLAENALYELGGIYRDQLGDPRKALAAWERYRSRYPRGLLRAEADLSIVDTLSHLGDMKRALKEADAFLARYPRSERRAEVTRVATEARRALGQSGAGPSD